MVDTLSAVKLLIAGGRTFTDYDLLVDEVIDFLGTAKPKPTIISGVAAGADMLGVRFAREAELELIPYPARWDLYGKSAGFRRNLEMADAATKAIIFWDGKSKGSEHMINICKTRGIPYKVVYYP